MSQETGPLSYTDDQSPCTNKLACPKFSGEDLSITSVVVLVFLSVVGIAIYAKTRNNYAGDASNDEEKSAQKIMDSVRRPQ